MLRHVALLTFLSCCCGAAAQDGVGTDGNTVELTVKPRLCIVDRRTPVCDARFEIAWRSARSGDYCVFSDDASQPLHCWTRQDAGEHVDERRASEAFRYLMRAGDDPQTVAEAEVEVLRVDSDDRRRSRRTRHVWDVL